MDKLWAPWRIKYLKAKKNRRCIFCEAKKINNRKDYVIFKSEHSLALLNIYPYNNGHLMVAPIRHVKDFSLLKEKEALDLFKSINKAKKLLDKVLNPDGYNIGANLSQAAGAGVPGHLHIHIVPRWRGDNNFMPTIFSTKIISQSLDELFRKLKYAQSKTN